CALIHEVAGDDPSAWSRTPPKYLGLCFSPVAPQFATTLPPRGDAARTTPAQSRAGCRRACEGSLSVSHANYLFTSESVSEGHPDKVCDQISDAILDAFIENDIKLGIADDSLVNTRLGCETLCTTNKIVIA